MFAEAFHSTFEFVTFFVSKVVDLLHLSFVLDFIWGFLHHNMIIFYLNPFFKL